MLVSNSNTIEWWLRKTLKDSKPAFRGIVGEEEIMMEEEGKEGDNKEKEKEKEKPSGRPENTPSELQLDFKFIGHEGNVTAMSLSQD